MEKRLFGTDGIRGRVGDFPITPDFVLKLGWAFGCVLRQYTNRPKVLIGKDTRISGYMFESALESGLTAAGVSSYMMGPMPTPAVAYLTQSLRMDAGIVISASHNPYYDNGMKFFSGRGMKLSDEMELEIEEQLSLPMVTLPSDRLGKAMRIPDAAVRYIEYCKSTFPRELSLKRLKVVLDCSNGATYHVAPVVFRELGAEVLELGVNPDGFNINAGCGSLYPEQLAKIVLDEHADIGIAFDGDGDRVILVDHQGEIVDGDEILFILANDFYKKGRLRGGVVGTVVSNYGLEMALRANDIHFIRSNVGDRYVLEELLSNDWVLGGESSGHVICLDFATSGDGIITALQVLAAMVTYGRSLNSIKKGMEKLPQRLVNVPIKTCVPLGNYPVIQTAVQSAINRLQNRGRVVLRPSGTEPLIRIMVEGKDLSEIDEIAEGLAGIVRQVLE